MPIKTDPTDLESSRYYALENFNTLLRQVDVPNCFSNIRGEAAHLWQSKHHVGEISDETLKLFDNAVYVSYTYLSYMEWSPRQNPENLLEPDVIKQVVNENKFLVVDLTHEGWSPEEANVVVTLHEVLPRAGIRHDQVIVMSGNLKEKEQYDLWCKRKNTHNKMHLFNFTVFDSGMFMCLEHPIDHLIHQRQHTLAEKYEDGKYFICLNRAPRPWRQYFIYKMVKAGLKQHALISFDRIAKEDGYWEWFKEHMSIMDIDEIQDVFKEASIVDIRDFKVNQANNISFDIHMKSLFTVVTETQPLNFNNTSLFLSEKTFRPNVLGMPYLVFGQKDTHKTLRDFGYKLFDDIFDYDFDGIDDTNKRADMLVSQLKSIENDLQSKTRTQQIDWSLNHMDKFIHNLYQTENNYQSVTAINDILSILQTR